MRIGDVVTLEKVPWQQCPMQMSQCHCLWILLVNKTKSFLQAVDNLSTSRMFNPLKPDIWKNSQKNIYFLMKQFIKILKKSDFWVQYLIPEAFVIHSVYENMERKKTFYSEDQTEKKYALCCSCWYLYSQKVRWN